MNGLPTGSLLGISLLHITKAQAADVSQLEGRTAHGLSIAAGWRRRLPVIDDISPAEPSMTTLLPSVQGTARLVLNCGGRAADAQKVLKAFGNRLASLARMPLRFERVVAHGLVHLAPSHHHLGACGTMLDGAASAMAATCPHCILMALTPPPMDRSCDFHPGGRVYVDDAELRSLRDHVCRGAHSTRGISAASTR